MAGVERAETDPDASPALAVGDFGHGIIPDWCLENRYNRSEHIRGSALYSGTADPQLSWHRPGDFNFGRCHRRNALRPPRDLVAPLATFSLGGSRHHSGLFRDRADRRSAGFDARWHYLFGHGGGAVVAAAATGAWRRGHTGQFLVRGDDRYACRLYHDG